MNRIWKILLVVLLVLVTAASTFLLTANWMAARYEAKIDTDPVEYKMEQLMILLETYFIDDYDPDVLMQAAAS